MSNRRGAAAGTAENMNSLRVALDRRLFSDDVVVRTVHRYTALLGVEILSTDTALGVVLTPLDGNELPPDLKARFMNDALDERLRESVRIETAQLQRDLIQAALREAQPLKPLLSL